ncbi:MAG: cell wall-binding repeat-containing protein [Tissierellia bacterium]|nr:cell wall-binding repeat-containing protein [Tissierellia bacterium]
MKKTKRILSLLLALMMLFSFTVPGLASGYGGGAAVNFFVGEQYADLAGVDVNSIIVTISDGTNTWTGVPSPYGSQHQQYVMDVPEGEYDFNIIAPGYDVVIDESDLPAVNGGKITVPKFKNSVYVLLSPENAAPTISGVKNYKVAVGTPVDLLAGVTASDKEDGDLTAALSVTPGTVDTSTPGKTTVTYSVKDSAGKTATATATVEVNALPTINAENRTITQGDAFDPLTGVTASDLEDGDLTAKIQVVANAVKPDTPGVYSVTYKVEDSMGNSFTKTIYVTVTEKPSDTDPVLNVNAPATVEYGASVNLKDFATATDKEDGDLTAKITVAPATLDTSKAGPVEITYSVTDSDGNTVTKKVTITVAEKPNTDPVLDVEDTKIPFGEEFDPKTIATATDAEDGDITDQIVITGGPVDVNTEGETKLTYSVTDSDGNTVTKEVTITVEKGISAPPTIKVPTEGDKKIEGTGTPGATVTVTLPDGTTKEAPVGQDGKWSVDVDTELKKGDKISATQTETGKKPSSAVTVTVAGKGGTGTGGSTPTPDNPAGPDDEIDYERIYGDDRIDTAIEISKKYPKSADTVIVVRHNLFPDSLTATVLANAIDAPILLTRPEKLDPRVEAEIERLGADEVIIVGGLDSIHLATEQELNKFDAEIERLGGPNRYDTSALVAERVVGVVGQKGKAVVASGEVFPDALAISPFAASNGYPILLARQNSVDATVEKAFTDLKITNVYLIGGVNTISQALEAKLPGVIERIGGTDRYETSTLIAESKFKSATRAFVASGEVFADALVIGPVAGGVNEPILLARAATAPAVVVEYIQNSPITFLTIIGGPDTISDAVVKALVTKK